MKQLIKRLFGLQQVQPVKPNRLYFVTRTDLSEGRRAAQLIHAMDDWSQRFGPQQGTVIVYEVPDEETLVQLRNTLGPNTVAFREPDLGHSMTAISTEHGPLDLPLLGSRRRKRRKLIAQRSTSGSSEKAA